MWFRKCPLSGCCVRDIETLLQTDGKVVAKIERLPVSGEMLFRLKLKHD
jgi:hypothetical protein